MIYFEVILNEEGMWIGEIPKSKGVEVTTKELKKQLDEMSNAELWKLKRLYEDTGQTKKREIVQTELRNRFANAVSS